MESDEIKTNDIMILKSEVPTTAQELVPYILDKTNLVNAIKVLIKSGKLTQDKLNNYLAKGQEQAGLVLDAKAALGNIIASTPKGIPGVKPGLRSSTEHNKKTVFTGLGLSRKQSDNYQLMAQNQKAVEKAKTTAQEKREFPSETSVMKIIKQENDKTKLFFPDQMGLGKAKVNLGKKPPTVRLMDCVDFLTRCKPYDMLITEPPRLNELELLGDFINEWLYLALEKLKLTGSAYIILNGCPKELGIYLNTKIPDSIRLEEILVWIDNDHSRYELNHNYSRNYFKILYYRGSDSGGITTSENLYAANKMRKNLLLRSMFIHYSTKEGDRVVDPFCKAGDSLIEASILGRIGLGADENEDALANAVLLGCKLESSELDANDDIYF